MDIFLTEAKLQNRIAEVSGYRYRDVTDLHSLAVMEENSGLPNPELPKDRKGFTPINLGDTWKGWDKYLWLSGKAMIPEEWRGRRAVALFDFGKTGDGTNSGFESMLYLDGKPYQGVDSNHKEVFLKEDKIGKEVEFFFRLWSGMEGGGQPRVQEHKFSQAAIAWLDEATDDLYYMAKTVLDTVKVLPEENPDRQELLSLLNRSMNLLDWSVPGSSAFYESVKEADEALNKGIEKMEKHSKVTVNCVGHTHIDVAWLWRLKHTREKGSRSFSTVMRLMELFPEYIFLQTQPQIYQYIKEDFPELYEEIKERVKEGRWEVDGAMWVEADCNLTSGESLTRQILLGSKFMKEEFGKEPEYLWLPDVFGYSWALPQILKKSGIDMFMTTKISWNQYNRMPHDTFWWKGIDGSEVLTHFITTPEPGKPEDSWFYTYNGQLLAETVQGVWKGYRDKEVNRDMLISYGYGDGGGGVNRDMLESRRRLDKVPGLPHVKTSTAGEYFRRLKETVKNTDSYVHTWDGELYLEFHRGTYTSQAYNKRMNRRMEMLYRQAEWLTVMGAIWANDLTLAKQDKLNKGWEMILTHQFHDIIPGSSIRQVYEDSVVNYGKMEKIGEEVKEDFAASFMEKEDDIYTVFNDGGWERDTLISLPFAGGHFEDSQGNVLPMQTEKDHAYVRVGNLPAAGWKQILVKSGDVSVKESSIFSIEDRKIETPFYVAVFNEAGQFTRLFDKTYGREVLAAGERGNVLEVFEDKPNACDAWDIDIFYQQKRKEITKIKVMEWTQKGPLRACLRLVYEYGSSTVEQNVIFYADDRRIDFETKVDFHEQHQLIKAAFPVDIRSTYATYDVQYGNVRRPNHWNTSWEMARFESVAHRFVDLSERNYGVSLLNDCKYGHDVYGNTLRLTLLKGATYPDYAADQGEHVFTYSLLPHGGDFVDAKVVPAAFDLNQPAAVFAGAVTGERKEGSFLTFDNGQVELDAIKKSEDGKYLIVRFHEFAGSHQQVEVKPSFGFKKWMECDLRERPITQESTEAVKLTLTPYEIKTVMFEI